MELRTPAQIEADNKAFSALSPAEQRVALAKDVIQQLNARRFVASAGTYVFAENIRELLFQNNKTEVELQKLFNNTPECDVCAKGALFVCLIDKKNQLKLNEVTTYSNGEIDGISVTKYLRRLFDRDQLELIESAFVQTEMTDGNAEYSRLLAAIDFGDWYDSSNERLVAIMENIIKNKGEFIP